MCQGGATCVPTDWCFDERDNTIKKPTKCVDLVDPI